MIGITQRNFLGILLGITIIVASIIGYFAFVTKTIPLQRQTSSETQINPKNDTSNEVYKPGNLGWEWSVDDTITDIDYEKQIFYFPPAFYKSEPPDPNLPIGFRVTPKTIIKKGNYTIPFNDLKIGTSVYVRALVEGIEEGQEINTTTFVMVVDRTERINAIAVIKNIDELKGILAYEIFTPPHRRGQVEIVTILPETMIQKGKPEEGELRPIVGLNAVRIGDIAIVQGFKYGNGNFLVEIDIPKPYFCEKYIKPPGCIETTKTTPSINVKELAEAPERFLNKTVQSSGILINLSSSYFAPEFAISNGASNFHVNAWLPLEVPPLAPGSPQEIPPLVMGDFLNKLMFLEGIVKKSSSYYYLDVVKAKLD